MVLKKLIESKEENNVQKFFWKIKMFAYFDLDTFNSLVDFTRKEFLPITKFSNNKRTSNSIMNKCSKILDKLEARIIKSPERFCNWYKYIGPEFLDRSNNRHERMNRKMRDKLQLLPAGSTERKIISQRKAFYSCVTDFLIDFHTKKMKIKLQESSRVMHERFYNASLNEKTECSIEEIFKAI